MPFLAYKITHRDSGKAYIGITTRTLALRWKEHRNPNSRRIGALGRAVQKYGREAFSVEHIASAISLADLMCLEEILIGQHGTLTPAGYNLTIVSEGAHTASDETRARISAVSRSMSAETRAKIGAIVSSRKVSAETRAKIGAAQKGMKRSPETVERIRAALFARPKKPKAIKEKRPRPTVSDETRAKLSAALRGKPKSPEWCRYLSNRQTGRRLTEETKSRIAHTLRQRSAQGQLELPQ